MKKLLISLVLATSPIFCMEQEPIAGEQAVASAAAPAQEHQQEVLPENCSNKYLIEFARRHPNLTALHLKNSPRLVDATLWAVVRALPKLTQLHIESCARLTEEGIIDITVFSNIRDIHLTRCNQVTNKLVTTLAIHCAQLHRMRKPQKARGLYIKSCSCIDGDAMGQLSNYMGYVFDNTDLATN